LIWNSIVEHVTNVVNIVYADLTEVLKDEKLMEFFK